MAHYIRRHSMERLELYDLDKFTSTSLTNPPPPLPPPRKIEFRRSSMNPSVERYQFLCNTTRNRTDPIYAATPMFTTIPNSKPETSHRQLLGACIREENVKQLDSSAPQPPETQPIKGQQNEVEDEKHDDNNDDQESDETDGDQFSSSSSSSEDDDDGEDPEDEKGVVEQIINRDKKN